MARAVTRTLMLVLAFVFALASPAAIAASVSVPSGTLSSPPELHVAGRQLLTASGTEVWLQGVNVVSLEYMLAGDHVREAIGVALGGWKANAIRLPVNDAYWFGRDKKQTDGGDAYRRLVAEMVQLVTSRGAYVILDLHRFGAARVEHVDFWRAAATAYANQPGVLFDVFNEPHSISWDVWRNGGWVGERKTPADEDAFLPEADQAKARAGFQSPGMQKLVDVIRSVGARNVIIAGGLDWAYDLSGVVNGYALSDPSGNGIVYSTHIYPWKNDWAAKVLPAAGRYAVIVGEVGADAKKVSFVPLDRQEDPFTWVPDVLGFIQQHHLHWTAWSFNPKTTPVLISDWHFTPTPFWGAFAKEALAGRRFELKRMR